MRQLPSVSDQEIIESPPHTPPPPIPSCDPPQFEGTNTPVYMNGFHTTQHTNRVHTTHETNGFDQIDREEKYRTSIHVTYVTEYCNARGPSTDDSRNGSNLVIEHEGGFDMNDSTNGRPLSRTSNKGPLTSPPKSSTLPPNTTPSTPPPFIESRSGSLKPQLPPRAQKSGGDFVAWSERGQSSDRQDSSDTSMEQKRGSKKIFGGLFKGKKHRESKDLNK